MSKHRAFHRFFFLQTMIFLMSGCDCQKSVFQKWVVIAHQAGRIKGILEHATGCLVSQLLFCQTSYSKIYLLSFPLTYLLAIGCLEGRIKCSSQRFLYPYTYLNCVKFVNSYQHLRVTQPTYVNNYLQMQVTVISKVELMKPVQVLSPVCGASVSAGTLYRLICEQLKDPCHPSALGTFGFLPFDCSVPLPCPASLQPGQPQSFPVFRRGLPCAWE